MPVVSAGVVATRGPVVVIGSGLIGTSVGLALSTAGVPVYLWDPSPVALALASDIGAGQRLPSSPDDGPLGLAPELVVVAAPPDVCAPVISSCLRAFPEAVVTDVASVKEPIVAELMGEGGHSDAELSRYVSSHPMAGRARSGAAHADADLFVGRPWVIVPTPSSSPSAVLTVRGLAADVGAVPVELDSQEHDQAVALVSHVPQLVSSLLAARLASATPEALGLAGQGLRDTTRIAASDPGLWTSIIAGNAGRVGEILRALAVDLGELVEGLEAGGIREDGSIAPGVAGAVAKVMAAGNRGVERIPGKHGEAPRRWGTLEVLVPDEPGELGRLFSEMGSMGVNIEDLALEHSAGQPVGLARLMVDPGRVREAETELQRRGWRVASAALK